MWGEGGRQGKEREGGGRCNKGKDSAMKTTVNARRHIIPPPLPLPPLRLQLLEAAVAAAATAASAVPPLTRIVRPEREVAVHPQHPGRPGEGVGRGAAQYGREDGVYVALEAAAAFHRGRLQLQEQGFW